MDGNAYSTAVKLLALGFSVIPSGGGDKGKAPLVNWEDFQDALPSAQQLPGWQDQFQPLLWGIVTNDHIAVIDVDTPNRRVEFEVELGKPHIETPRGGAHWYIDTAGHPLKTKVGIMPGVDVRGVGGFANVAGKNPLTGGEYKIVKLPAPDNLIAWDSLSKWILEALEDSRPATKPKQGGAIPETTRNDTLTRVAGAMRHHGADQTAIEAALLKMNTAQCQPPLEDREVLAIAKSVARYEPEPDQPMYFDPTDHGNGNAEHFRHLHILASSGEVKEQSDRYLCHDKKGRHLDMPKLVYDLLAEYSFKTLRDTEECYVYEDGVYILLGEAVIKEECGRRVPIKYMSQYNRNEAIGHIKYKTYMDRAEFNREKQVLNLKNGLYNILNGELTPHTPEFLSTIRIPVEYDPKAGCPRIKQFLGEILKSEDIPAIQEFFGYCLIPDYSIQKAILLLGDGANGKSTLLNLQKEFIGKDNCSGVPWHALEQDRFAKAALEGKLVNMFADVPSQSIKSTSTFKKLTGGDPIGAEKKFKSYFTFINYARLVFSANKPPEVLGEDSYAFWRRWVIINFPNEFTGERADKQLLTKLTAQEELSGLLNLALDGLKRLLQQQEFSYTKSVEDTTEIYLRAADPVYAFLKDMCESDPEGWISKEELYESFKQYCQDNNTPIKKPNSFARALQNQTHISVKSTRPKIGDSQVRGWQGIKYNEDSEK